MVELGPDDIELRGDSEILWASATVDGSGSEKEKSMILAEVGYEAVRVVEDVEPENEVVLVLENLDVEV